MSIDRLWAEVLNTIRLYEKLLGHRASATWRKIGRPNLIEALSNLMVSSKLQQGFQVLRDHGQLAKTFEALVVRYHKLFRDEVVEAAQWRLDHPYDLFRA